MGHVFTAAPRPRCCPPSPGDGRRPISSPSLSLPSLSLPSLSLRLFPSRLFPSRLVVCMFSRPLCILFAQPPCHPSHHLARANKKAPTRKKKKKKKKKPPPQKKKKKKKKKS